MKLLVVAVALALSIDAGAAVSEWIPFDSQGGHISIPVTVNGVETRALLDSGATANGISERLLANHEGQETNVGEGVRAKVGTRIKKTSSDGLLGYGVLKHFVVTIDYKRSFLHLGLPAE